MLGALFGSAEPASEETTEIVAVEVETENVVAEDSEMTEPDTSENVAANDAEMNEAEKTETEGSAAAETGEKVEESKTEEEVKKPYVKPQIYAGKLAFASTEEEIKTYFEAFGELSVFTLAKTKSKKNGGDGKKSHRGFAFLAYVDENVTKTVLEKKDHKLGDREITVDAAKPKTQRIFVGGLDKGETKEEEIREYFAKLGEITDLLLMRNKGFAFVTLIDDGENVKAILDKGKHEIGGKIRDVKTARPRGEGAARGGRGGRGFRGRGRGGKGARGGAWGPMGFGGYGNPYGGYGRQFQPYGQQAFGQYAGAGFGGGYPRQF